MNRWTRTMLLVVTLLLVLAMSAIWVVPVWADDGTPPPTETPIVTTTDSASTSEGSSTSSAITPTDESATPTVDTSATTTSDATLSAPTADVSSTLSDTQVVSTSTDAPVDLTQIPTATDVVVLDQNGDAVPLATQEAANIISTGDPIWCPSTVTIPKPGVGGCSPAIYNSDLATLINSIALGNFTPPSTNSTIWITGGTNTTTDVSLDGSSAFSSWSNFTLTLKGGWNGPGTGTVNVLNPSTFNSSISITNWNNTVTLSDIAINGSYNTGLVVSDHKNIVLRRVSSNSNTGDGADLDTTLGAGAINVINSSFNSNSGPLGLPAAGLHAVGNGSITLTGVTADNNTGVGAYVNNQSASSSMPITIKGLSTFSSNGGTGVVAYSKGVITVTDMTASGNGATGANLDNTPSTTSAGITLTGTNIFNSNATQGLILVSKGAILSGSLSANDNGDYGVWLDNHGSATAVPVTLSGTSSFSGNTHTGLYVYSQGTITLNNLNANGNGYYGAFLEDDYSFTSPVKVTGTNWFANNGFDGLHVQSKGAITLNNINANRNSQAGTFYGLFADNTAASTPQGITLTGFNNFDKNAEGGAVFQATGAVTLNNVTALYNGYNPTGAGIIIRNSYLGSSAPQKVSLLGTNLLDGNNNDNLDVQTYGAIAINNLTASHSDTGDGANLYLDSLAVTGNVTLTGTNVFEGNSSGGFALIVNSKGSITANNLNVIANTYGAFVDNTAGTANVTLTGSNLFKGQNGTALSVTSKGTISVSNLSVESNFANGVKLDNSTGTGNVVLTGYGIFTNNGGYGLDISSKGAVTATNLTADYNHLSFSSYAVEIDNSSALTPKAVTLNGTNTFIGNGKYGLGVSSKGAITVSNLTANDNKAAGAYLNNDHAGAVGGITLKGSSAFLENGAGIFNVGVELASIGKITLTHVTADFNYQNGLQVDNASSVTITCGSFMDNGNAAGQYGIWANTPLLTLIGIDASGNYSGSYYSTGSIVFGTRTCTLP